MSNNTVMEVKNMLRQFAERCKEYRILEKVIKEAKDALYASEDKLFKQKMELDKLVKQAGDLNPIDLDILKQEILDLYLENERLGVFAIKRKRVIRALLSEKEPALQEATRNNELIKKLNKEKQQFAYWSEQESKNQAALKSEIETASQQMPLLTAAIEKCVAAILDLPDDLLTNLLSEIGTDMVYLPYVVLKKAITKGVPANIKYASVHQQVRLLFQYDVPIHFGGRDWNVLHVKRDKALLLLKDAYTCPKYYREKHGWEEEPSAENAFHRGDSISVKWETSEARKILNNDFVQSLRLKHGEKILNGFNGDKVFCLSKSEVEQYLGPHQRRVEGAWWLRDTEYYRGNEYIEAHTDVFYVSMFGDIDKTKSSMLVNNFRDGQSMCFRPALWVELPYDSLDKEWNAENIDVNCKGMWTSENVYSRTSVSFDSLAQSLGKSSNFTDADAWHAIASGMMGGNGIDGTGV